MIGVSWIGNKGDSTNLSFSDRINVMRLSREDPAMVANSCKPFQAYLALGRYPLTRDVYILLTDPKKRTGLRLHHFHKLGPRTAYHLKIRHRSRHPVDPAGERP